MCPLNIHAKHLPGHVKADLVAMRGNNELIKSALSMNAKERGLFPFEWNIQNVAVKCMRALEALNLSYDVQHMMHTPHTITHKMTA